MEQPEIIIANPIYDVVFKSLMTTANGTNKENAKFFVGTILGEQITDIELLPQEYPYHTKPKKKNKEQSVKSEVLTLIRLDFVATIRTKSGEQKKVLIEIQKSQKATDLIRFRTYLGEQYKQTDTIEIKGNTIERTMPIVIIYMLGFVLPEIEAIAVKVNRTYIDIMYGGEVHSKSPFIESLTHDGYFMQIPRITAETFRDWENCTILQQLLSLFEQNYFVEADFYKKYPYPITNKNMKRMIESLAYIVADPVTKRIMQEEYWDALNETLWENQVIAQADQIANQADQIANQADQIEKQSNQIENQSNQIATLNNVNTELNNVNTELSNENAELRRLLQQAGINIPHIHN